MSLPGDSPMVLGMDIFIQRQSYLFPKYKDEAEACCSEHFGQKTGPVITYLGKIDIHIIYYIERVIQ